MNVLRCLRLVLVDESVLDSEVLSEEILARVRMLVWGIWGLMGHGVEPLDTCGLHRRFNGCLGRDGSHDKVDVYGHNFHGKMAYQDVFMRCYRARCFVCFREGFVKRVADRVTGYLEELSKKLGLVEHGTISVPLKDYARLLKMGVKEFSAYWRMVEGVLLELGVVGVSMFHPARYSPDRGWYFSPHFHFSGCIVPSYGRCRRCTDKVCRGRSGEFSRCDGFDARCRRVNVDFGFIIRVFGKRKKEWIRYDFDGEDVIVLGDKDNVRGTVAYELSHAGLVVGSKRANVVHWFGVKLRGMKIVVVRRKQLCPACGGEFVQIRRLRFDFDLPSGRGVHFIDLCGSDGEERFIEAFADSGG